MGFIKYSILILAIFININIAANPPQSDAARAEVPAILEDNILIKIETNMGTIYAELNYIADPITVNHFLKLVDKGFYNGLIFHRIIEGFIIQAGKYDSELDAKPIRVFPLENQSQNTKLKNIRGSLAFAHEISNPNSAKTEFFVNLLDNSSLDSQKNKAGYAVFGQIIKGMDVVQKISGIKTWEKNGMLYTPFYPNEALIKEISRVPDHPTKR